MFSLIGPQVLLRFTADDSCLTVNLRTLRDQYSRLTRWNTAPDLLGANVFVLDAVRGKRRAVSRPSTGGGAAA
jgi:hypothetical protein